MVVPNGGHSERNRISDLKREIYQDITGKKIGGFCACSEKPDG
jgi:hypothetical protein